MRASREEPGSAEVDQPEVARPEHHRVSDAGTSGAAGSDRRLVPTRSSFREATRPPALDVRVDRGDGLAHQRRTDAGQVDAVPLGEGRPHRLAVVGEGDEVVATGRRLRHAWRGSPAPRPAPPATGATPAVPARVVGHLVVVDVVDVDRLGPRIISSATTAVFMSRSNPLLTARSPAKSRTGGPVATPPASLAAGLEPLRRPRRWCGRCSGRNRRGGPRTSRSPRVSRDPRVELDLAHRHRAARGVAARTGWTPRSRRRREGPARCWRASR